MYATNVSLNTLTPFYAHSSILIQDGMFLLPSMMIAHMMKFRTLKIMILLGSPENHFVVHRFDEIPRCQTRN